MIGKLEEDKTRPQGCCRRSANFAKHKSRRPTAKRPNANLQATWNAEMLVLSESS